MKRILDIVNRIPEPLPWAEGDNIPWNDPDFSERMLAEHLSRNRMGAAYHNVILRRAYATK